MILLAEVIPNRWLSLQARASGSPDAFRVRIDGDPVDVPIDTELGFEKMSGVYYLPRVAQITEEATVTVSPMSGGVEIGPESDPVVVALFYHSPETNVRQMVADCVTAAELSYRGEVAWVNRDRTGRPRTLSGNVGKSGPVVEVGVSFMSGEDPFANSTDTDTDMTVPVRVMVKGDNPDKAQEAVDIAYMIRGALTDLLQLEGYGITLWRWSGTAPVQAYNGWVVEMKMTLTRFAEQGFCEA